MTVQASILNHGNHPDDTVTIEGIREHSGERYTVNLLHGKSLSLDMGDQYKIIFNQHGSGVECRTHTAVALQKEGPGAALVRADFNPSEMGDIDSIKVLAAGLINAIETKGKDSRLTALAKTAIEVGAMWAVKSLTA